MKNARKKLHLRSLSLVMAILLAAGLLVACGGGDAGSQSTLSVPEPSPQESSKEESDTPAAPVSKNTLVIGETQEIQGTIPYDLGTSTTSAFEKVYDALVEREPSGKVIPAAAKSWEAIDELTWNFYLEENIYFSNGEHLNAEACVVTWEAIADPDIAWGNTNDLTSIIETVEAVDEFTVQFVTKEPFGTLPLRMMLFRVLPPKYFKEVGPEGLRDAPLGSGPYLFDQYVKGEVYSVKSNPDHWRGAPKIEEVTYVQIPDANARVMALEAGDVDLIGNVPISELARLEASPNICILEDKQLWTALGHPCEALVLASQ